MGQLRLEIGVRKQVGLFTKPFSEGWDFQGVEHGISVSPQQVQNHRDTIGWPSIGDRLELMLHFTLLIHLSFPLLSREWFPSYLLAPERISVMLRLCWSITSPTCRYPSGSPGEERARCSKGTETTSGYSQEQWCPVSLSVGTETAGWKFGTRGLDPRVFFVQPMSSFYIPESLAMQG